MIGYIGDIIFMIERKGCGYQIYTYNKNFIHLNTDVKSSQELYGAMEKISYECNNSSKGCYGCLFCMG